LEIAKQSPNRFKIIDASDPIEIIHAKIKDCVLKERKLSNA